MLEIKLGQRPIDGFKFNLVVVQLLLCERYDFVPHCDELNFTNEESLWVFRRGQQRNNLQVVAFVRGECPVYCKDCVGGIINMGVSNPGG